jgi:hypothetical protein
MTQAGIAELYQTSPQNITQPIAAIYAEATQAALAAMGRRLSND